jgi:hypothetical protein
MNISKYVKKNYAKIILAIIVLLLLGYFIKNIPHYYGKLRELFQRKTYGSELNKTIAGKTYSTKSKYADTKIKVGEDGETLYVTVNYKDVSQVGCIHIHSVMWGHEVTGDIGPPVAWLGTTDEWQHGVRQLTPGLSYPCCIKGDGLRCDFTAPHGTPDLKDLSFKTRTFVLKKPDFCTNECPWVYNGAYVLFHGKKIQQVYNGCLTQGKPNPDILGGSQMDMLDMTKAEEEK